MVFLPKPRHIAWLSHRPPIHAAHRGLFSTPHGRPENSGSAVKFGVQQGYGNEIDVRLTRDGTVIVFHDDTLDRMTGKSGKVADLTYDALADYRLIPSGESIARLKDILHIVSGKTPLIIEIKSSRENDPTALCAATYRDIQGYHGPVAIMSFDPRVVHWFKLHAPRIVRGVVLGEQALVKHSTFMVRYMLRRCRPDFLSADLRLLPHPLCTRWRKIGAPLMTWTVRTAHDEEKARKLVDIMTFEIPAVAGETPAVAGETPAVAGEIPAVAGEIPAVAGKQGS